MNTIKCAVEKCEVQFQTEEVLSPTVSFICKNHTKGIQRKAIRFQEVAFDPALSGRGRQTESEEYDRDWGLSGEPMAPSEKCVHGVYDPYDDQRYCTICNPTVVTGQLREVKKIKDGHIAVFKDLSEQTNQKISLILFYYALPESLQPTWFKDRELGFKARGKRGFDWLNKNNKSIIGQFLENE